MPAHYVEPALSAEIRRLDTVPETPDQAEAGRRLMERLRWMVSCRCLVVDPEGKPFAQGKIAGLDRWHGELVTVAVRIGKCRRRHWTGLTVHFRPERVLCEVDEE